ncbi:unnamed protein product [Scytosiphon promiscuus]
MCAVTSFGKDGQFLIRHQDEGEETSEDADSLRGRELRLAICFWRRSGRRRGRPRAVRAFPRGCSGGLLKGGGPGRALVRHVHELWDSLAPVGRELEGSHRLRLESMAVSNDLRGGALAATPALSDQITRLSFSRRTPHAAEQGIPSWVPVGILAADGTETLAYAAVYPLRCSRGEGGQRQGIHHALWEFHCVDRSTCLSMARLVEKLMAFMLLRVKEAMIEPAHTDSFHSLRRWATNTLSTDSSSLRFACTWRDRWGGEDEDNPRGGDAVKGKRRARARGRRETGLGAAVSGGNQGVRIGISSSSGVEDACDRRRAASSMEQLWRVYASVSHRELQFQSTSRIEMATSFCTALLPSFSRRISPCLVRDTRVFASTASRNGRGKTLERQNARTNNSEEETTHLLMKIIRRFFCETRRGVATQLLFHILEGCEDHPALGKVVEEFLWSSWNLHDDEQVIRLMSEATKFQEAGNFDRSNAAIEKVLEIDGGHFEALNCRATNLLLKGSLHESVAEIQKVLEIEPRHFGAMRGLGLLRMKLKDYSGALGAFELTAKINPMLLPGLRDNMAVCQAAGNAMMS